MSAPQLADSSTSSEWFRTVAESAATEKPRSPSQVSIPTDTRRKRFVRLVAYTMGGLVAFTVLGLASFAWRRHAMQSALATPVPVAPVVAAPLPEASPEPAPVTEVAPPAAAAVAKPAKPATAAKPAAVTKRTAAAKQTKKPASSPFLSAAKPAAKATSSARKL